VTSTADRPVEGVCYQTAKGNGIAPLLGEPASTGEGTRLRRSDFLAANLTGVATGSTYVGSS